MEPSTEQQHLLVHVSTIPVFLSWSTETAGVRCTHIFGVSLALGVPSLSWGAGAKVASLVVSLQASVTETQP